MTRPEMQKLREQISSDEHLEEVLTRPSAELVEFIKTLRGPLLLLGAGGKMGPTLAALAMRAAEAANHPLDVIAVSRFSDRGAVDWLERRRVKTISCDLLDSKAIEKLPDTENIVYLVGLKFGTAQNPAATWAVNTIAPIRVAERFPTARIVALSTGNVYPFSEVDRGGARETDPLTPVGEYANAAVARERLFEYYSHLNRMPAALLRLFYAVELRYGVLVDIARKVYSGAPLDLTTGYFNCIWQGDANDMVLRTLSLTSSPPSIWNLCRPEIFSVRSVAAHFGERFGKAPRFTGPEAATALIGNSAPLCARLGNPAVSLEKMVGWIAHWVEHCGRDLGKPTHFETRDGRY